MDIGKSFSYVFEDNEWLTKLGIGALVTIVPILNFAWFGYGIDIIRNVVRGDPRPLPSWDNFGEKFMDGLFIAIASLIYTLPASVILVVGIVLWFVPVSVSGENTDLQGILAGVGGIVFVGIICLCVLYFLAYSFFYPAMLIHYSRNSTFGALFQVREIIRLATRNLGQYATAWLVAIAAGLVAGFIAGIVSGALSFIFCVGWILSLVVSGLAGVWIGTILHHLYGQIALTV
jgi:hypothetical protein